MAYCKAGLAPVEYFTLNIELYCCCLFAIIILKIIIAIYTMVPYCLSLYILLLKPLIYRSYYFNNHSHIKFIQEWHIKTQQCRKLQVKINGLNTVVAMK